MDTPKLYVADAVDFNKKSRLVEAEYVCALRWSCLRTTKESYFMIMCGDVLLNRWNPNSQEKTGGLSKGVAQPTASGLLCIQGHYLVPVSSDLSSRKRSRNEAGRRTPHFNPNRAASGCALPRLGLPGRNFCTRQDF